MAAPVRTCCLRLSRAVQFVHKHELTGQILSVISKRNAGVVRSRRSIWLGQHHLAKHSDHSQVEQPTVVPVEKLKITYSRSGGPGGQHVNKVNTKAEVRFLVHAAEWIPEEVRNEIMFKYKSRINKAGELIVTSEVSRSQQRNLEDCVRKISEIISEASQKPPEPSEEDIALRAKRLEKRNLTRLKEKKLNSATKRARDVGFD